MRFFGKPRVRFTTNLLLFWLWTGFVGGAAVLLYFAAPIEGKFREMGMEQGSINKILFSVTFGWVVVAGGISYLLEKKLPSRRNFRIGAHAVGLVLFCLTFILFLRAGSGAFAGFRGKEESWGERFQFGPYPSVEDLKRLKGEGYTGVITLMSPMVPFEAVLLEEERTNAKAAGIELIEASMLPWVSSNEESLSKIRALVQKKTGRYYVHCYLGKNRAQLARFVIMDAGGIGDVLPLDGLRAALDRGILIYVGDTVVLGPHPTKDDWYDFVIRSGTRRVISLLDSADPEDAKRFKEITTMGEASGIEVSAIDVNSPADAGLVAAKIWSSSDRVYVHAYHTDEKAIWIARVLDPGGKRTIRPADSFEKFDPLHVLVPGKGGAKGSLPLPDRFERGKIAPVGENILLGPLPTQDEWSAHIGFSRITRVVTLLDPENPEDVPWIEEEKRLAAEYGIELMNFPVEHKSNAPGILRAVDEKGLTYFHGFGQDERLEWIEKHLSGEHTPPEKFERGKVEVLRGGIYLGPLPTTAEWDKYIASSGIRRVISLLDPSKDNENIRLSEMRYQTARSGMELVTIPVKTPSDAAVVADAALASEGAVYVHSYNVDSRIDWVRAALIGRD